MTIMVLVLVFLCFWLGLVKASGVVSGDMLMVPLVAFPLSASSDCFCRSGWMRSRPVWDIPSLFFFSSFFCFVVVGVGLFVMFVC
ncbi:hypothetical protein [Desulfobaculum sp.]